jgi:AcrR family transcriptional regulator
MMRWAPGTPERLQRAALELFADRGYEQTTAAEIADSVGLTERTFYRHFTDKREVLFHGQQQLTDAFLAGVGDAPPDASAIELGVCALRSAASYFPDDRRPDSRLRQSVIDKNPALQEREAHKMAVLGTALAEALRARGVDDLVADVAARTTVMAFGITFERWIRRGQRRSFTDVAADVLDEFAAVAGRLPRHR